VPSARTILTRIVFGAIMIAAIAAVLAVEYYQPWPAMIDIQGLLLAAVIVVLCVMALRELKRIASAAGAGLLTVSATVGTLLVATQPIWHKFVPVDFVLFSDFSPLSFVPMMTPADVWCMIGLIVAGVFLEQMIRSAVSSRSNRHHLDAALARVGVTVLAVVYLGVGAAIILAIRVDKGVPALILFLAAVKCTDIGAYFTGSTIGRHKLIGWLSPGKSWEGLLGGLAAAAGASMLVVWLFGMRMPLAWAAAFGVIVGAVGQFADLCESLLKRSARIKDSGALVPEFGGVLDVLDSPLLAAPAAWVLLNCLL
jgi:CDP-diglyceride synthetase